MSFIPNTGDYFYCGIRPVVRDQVISRFEFEPVGPEVRRYYRLDHAQEQA